MPFTPQLTLSSHRGPITAIAFGRSRTKTNIAVSASKDNTVIVWDYLSGRCLQNFLLSSPAQCLSLDPVDRAIYAGHADGSIHFLDLFSKTALSQNIRDASIQATPTQPGENDRWRLPTEGEGQGVLSIDISYDGTSLISGHEDGKMNSWDIAKGQFTSTLHDYTLPITNLLMLPPIGWPKPKIPHTRLRHVVKPRYESTFSNDSARGVSRDVPLHYTFTTYLPSSLSMSHFSATADSAFQEALTHPCFPKTLLEEGLTAFNSSSSAAPTQPLRQGSPATKLTDDAKELLEVEKLRKQNTSLTQQLGEALARGKEAVKENLRHDRERWKQQEEARMKAERKKRRRLRRLKIEENARKRVMDEPVEEDEEMGDAPKEAEDDQDLSSDTDDITDSDE